MTLEPRHFVDIVRRHASERGDALAYRFLRQEVETETLTFAELDRAARAIARAFEGRSGQHALLLFPPGLDFVKAFIGCWFAGVVPVPCAPPTREPELQRILRIARSAKVSVVLSAGGLLDLIRNELEKAQMTGIELLAADALVDGAEHPWKDPGLSSEMTALLQYTSGSTSDPKGVVVTHGNLLHNERMIQALFEHNQQTSVVGWLPLHHDMGLIGNVLQPLWLGRDVTLMSPVDFMMRPLSWLRTISKYRATTSGGPNFAFQLCVDAAKPEDIASLDLSTWTLAFNGAEPIRMGTLEAFSKTFEPCGFRPATFYPCYGLAEATLIVTGVQKSEVPRAKTYDRDALTQHRAVPAVGDASSSLVACGKSACGTRVSIVDPETRRRLDDGNIGEIWVAGGAVASGYYAQPELTAEIFGATISGESDTRWLRTGDLGFLESGELFVAGRLKDLLIVRGRNHHPQDIEQTAWESHQALREGRAAAFTIEREGDESLVVVQEVVRDLDIVKTSFDPNEVSALVRTNIARVHGLSLGALVLVRPGQVPKTSSGKIRRQACRALFMENALQLFSHTGS